MAEVITSERSRRASAPGASYWLGSKLLNQPMALTTEHAAHLQAALKSHAFDPAVTLGVSASKFIGRETGTSRYRVTEDGIALVAVGGMLLDRGEWLGDMYGMATTYEGLAEQFRRIAKDEAVKSVVLDIDSPGGMVAGCFDLVQGELTALKRKKKVYAIAANMSASAAYAIGCSAHELYTTKFASVGSIGVIMLHQSYAGMLEGAGIETTIIQAGSHKSDGNPYQALSHGARAEMSAECDQAYDMFVSHVAKARGLEESAVRATEARCYYGEKAVSAGLADGVKSIDDLLKYIRNGSTKSTKKAGRGSNASTGGRMSTENNGTGERPDYEGLIAASLATLAAASKSAPVAPAQPASAPAAAAPAASPVDAASAERARIAAIVDSPEGKANAALAAHFAFKTSMSADDAIAALKAAGPAAAATAAPAASPMADALNAQMRNPANSGGVKPEAPGADPTASAGLPALGDVFASRFAPNRSTKRKG